MDKKKYIMLFNHDEDDKKMLDDLIKFFPEVKLLLPTKTLFFRSSWIPEEQFLATYIFINMYHYDNEEEYGDFRREFVSEYTIKDAIDWKNKQEKDGDIKWF